MAVWNTKTGLKAIYCKRNSLWSLINQNVAKKTKVFICFSVLGDMNGMFRCYVTE